MDDAAVPLLCGLDEAGCGPLAGPVVAGCVILPNDFPVEILHDSKKMTSKARAMARKVILRYGCCGLGTVDAKTIDEINILRSRLLAMQKAYEDMMTHLPVWQAMYVSNCGKAVISAIVDGTFSPVLPCSVRCEARADGKFPVVMAASIIAKEERDEIMIRMDALYPQYGYARNKGYPTKEHIKVLHEIGASPIQRLSFKYH